MMDGLLPSCSRKKTHVEVGRDGARERGMKHRKGWCEKRERREGGREGESEGESEGGRE